MLYHEKIKKEMAQNFMRRGLNFTDAWQLASLQIIEDDLDDLSPTEIKKKRDLEAKLS